ncbi:MAG: ROK family transcriptional regulator [Oscillospiraceae bacterium]
MAGNTRQLRIINANAIRRALKKAPGSTKAEIARASGLSYATCNTIVNQLAATGEVLETPLPTAGSGRPAAQYHYNPHFSYWLCISLSFDNHRPAAQSTVFNLLGQPVSEALQKFDALTVKGLTHFIETQIAGHPGISIVALGIPGVVQNGKSVAYCDIPAFNNCPLAEQLQKALGLPVFLENDMNLAVLGFHQSRGLAPAASVAGVLFPLGNGPGAGLLADGRIMRGAGNFAGEIAWLPFMPEEVRRGRPVAGPALVDTVAKTLVSLIAIVSPHILLLGGGLLQAGMLPAIRQSCRQLLPAQQLPEIYFEASFSPHIMLGLLALVREYVENTVQLIEKPL